MVALLITIFSAAICGVLGRAGGSGNFPRQLRVVGIPLLLGADAFLLGIHSFWIILFILVMMASISTYWDFMFKYDNYWYHGFICGLSCFPLCLSVGHWSFLALLSFICAISMGGWSAIFKNAVWEESGRYALLSLCVTTFILLIR